MDVLIPLFAFILGAFSSKSVRRLFFTQDRRVEQLIRFEALALDVKSAQAELEKESTREAIEELIRHQEER